MLQAGFPPYRINHLAMAELTSANTPYWEAVRQLGDLLDPQRIFAPGRYVRVDS